MPSAPSYPGERQSAQRAASRREHESFEGIESGALTLAASAEFQTVREFSGRPDSITVDVSAAGVEVRFRNRGGPPTSGTVIQAAGERRFLVNFEIVEARDPAAAGGQLVSATGRWASRQIDVRNNFPGPSRERPTLPDAARADQVLTSE